MRRRYLALKWDSDETFSSREFLSAVWDAILRLYGEYGASRTGLALTDFDAEERFATLRVAHTAVDMVRAALASLTEIRDKPVAVHVLRVSGTIRGLYEKIKQ